ncbi:MAG: ribosome-binding factor A [Actinobacteria bacterium RBG_19FT_COMBO_70_19]|jgi:ribosome-binding factor A|nr:MAG: ribosome-binding factor A [Actinobacteria bacterium RBG_19FT_COMBO_70_19]
MTEGTRPSRVREEFREILAEEILKLKDPRVGFVTVTGVKVTPDLRRAIVFYTALGDEKDRKATAAGLRSATAHLRRVLGHQIRLKTLPVLEFEEDETAETADRIERLIQQLHEGER